MIMWGLGSGLVRKEQWVIGLAPLGFFGDIHIAH